MTVSTTQLEFPFVYDLPKAAAQTATFWGKCKNFGDFLIGEWAKPTGIEYHALKKTKNHISIFDAYHRYFDNKLEIPKAQQASSRFAKVAKAAAKAAGTEGTKKGFFKSIGGFLGKFAGPVMMWLEPIMNVVSEIKNGGNIVSITKEFAKGMCGMAGYAAGTLFATAVLGLTTGFWAGAGIMVLGVLGGMAFNYVAKAILGESTGEKLARQKEEQQQNPFGQTQGLPGSYPQTQLAGNSFGGYNRYNRPVNIQETMQKAEASFKAAQNIFLNRNGTGCLV